MCGIIGQFDFNDREPGEGKKIVPALMRLMIRRGPDDEGIWSDGKICTLGACRLAISDLSPAGHQPMQTQDGRYVLTYNGEVYNFQQLKQELEQKGVRFRSTGDTEVVLYALAQWGTEALSRFNGMFALAFYDSVKRRLLLAIDHAGIKPLYYLLSSSGVVFASQYDQILRHPWSQKLKVSEEALGLYLRLGYIPDSYAMLQNTHVVKPGAWLEITSEGKVRQDNFFAFPLYCPPQLNGDEAYEAIDSVITAAVRRQKVSDVPLGTFLSGGIDSPLVSAKLREATNHTFKAFTIGSNDDFDESSDAQRYSQEIGVENVVEEFSLDQIPTMLHDVVAACGEPFADNSIFPMLAVSRLARREVKVVLSGDGGDELFWGYAGRFASVLEKTSKFTSSQDEGKARLNIKKLFDLGIGQQNPSWPDSLGASCRIRATHISEGWLQRIFRGLPEWPSDFELFTHTSWETDQTAQWLRWNEFMGPLRKILLKVDRGSMYHSLEVRVPLLDKEVVEMAMRVDWSSCLNVEKRIGKLPLRHSLARHVRHQTLSKRGFSVPIDDWFRGVFRRKFEETVLLRKAIMNIPVNTMALREYFGRHLSGQANYGWGLWVLMSLVMWEDQHFHGVNGRSSILNQPSTSLI
jgi:asparagine synthase (glutamine-hydrolysing)